MRLILACLLAVSYPLAAGDSRQPVPDQAKQAESENLIEDLFKTDYAKPAAADKLALAQKLLQQATETKDDPAARFVLLREARDLAALAGDTETAFSSVDQMAKDFAVDGGAEKLTVLPKLESSARTPEQAGKLVEALIQAADGAIDADDYGMAGKLMMRAESVATRAQSAPLLAKARARRKEIQDLAQQSKGLEAARKTLSEKPDDPEANLAVGKFTCFVKGDWENGLPMLAKGSDLGLKAMAEAERDLSAPLDGAAQLRIGDGWWDMAEKESGAAKVNVQRRSAKWYRDALPKLTGLNKVKLERRLDALNRVPLASAPGNRLPKLKGSFFASADNAASIYLNGKKIMSVDGFGQTFQSIEVELSIGDLVVVDLYNDEGGPMGFKMVFLAADNRYAIHFKRVNYHGVPADVEVSSMRANATPTLPAPVVVHKDGFWQFALPNNLPESADWVWGKGNKCRIGAVIKPEMIASTPSVNR